MYPALGIFSWVLPTRYNFLIYIDQALNGIPVYYSRVWFVAYIVFMLLPFTMMWNIKRCVEASGLCALKCKSHVEIHKSRFGDLVRSYFDEFRLVFHDGGIILFFCFLPLAYPIIYSLIYNPEVVRDVKMVVVDHDRTSKSRELVRSLDACQEIRITGYAADLDEAKRAMHGHDCYGILEIPDGFSKRLGRGEQSPAVICNDMSLLLRYRGFLVAATNVAQEMGAGLLEEKIGHTLPIAATISTGDPLPVENISMGNIENGFDSFIMPGVLVLILHQCIVLASGMAGGARRERTRRGCGEETGSVAVSAGRRDALLYDDTSGAGHVPSPLCPAHLLFPDGGERV